GLLDSLSQVFVLLARAFGITRSRVLFRHALRNALLPLITIFGMSFPNLVGGAVIVEKVFSWQGLGSLAANAVSERDVPVIMAMNLLFAVFVVAGNLFADLMYLWADPRISARPRRARP
ncbi:MAG: ABC transporter permease, partial [Acidobacteriota bacterium]